MLESIITQVLIVCSYYLLIMFGVTKSIICLLKMRYFIFWVNSSTRSNNLNKHFLDVANWLFKREFYVTVLFDITSY